jgi:hypothetical protein
LRPVREGQKWGGLGRQARWIRGEANWWAIQEPRGAIEGVDDEEIKLESTGERDGGEQK